MAVSTYEQNFTTRAIGRLFWAALPLRSPYLFTLDRIHQHLRPRTYVEVGVSKGKSLALVLPGTLAIGVDPAPRVCYPLRRGTRVFEQTSDDFFENHDPNALLGGLPLDLGFIDGMHQFEFTLRDFMHLERFAHSDTTILVHDCYPLSKDTATRERQTKQWSGDVWKLVVCLKEWRSDLKIDVVDVHPTGLGVITALDSSSRVLEEHYDEIVRHAAGLRYEFLEDQGKDNVLNRVPSDWLSVRNLLPNRPFRSDSVHLLTAQRAASTWLYKAVGSSSPPAPDA